MGYLDHSFSSDSGLFLVKTADGLYAIVMLNATIPRPRKKFMFEPTLTDMGV
jgi:hypothetical protein